MSQYLKPDVYSILNPLLGTPVGGLSSVIPALIGKSNGKVVETQDEALVKGVANGSDPLSVPLAIAITRVSLVDGGIANYTSGVDYQLDAPNLVKWLGTVLTPIANLSAVGSSVGGTLAAGTYYYVITAIRKVNLTGPVYGETLVSNEVTVVLSGATSKVALAWTPVALAEGYRIYRTTVSADYTSKKIQEVTGGSTSSFVDTGFATTAFTPPVSNTALKQPATGATYFTSYTTQVYQLQTFLSYTSLTNVIRDHGVGSDIAKAATLTMGKPGFGNGAPMIGVVGVSSSAVPTDYVSAMVQLENQDIQIMVPLIDDDVVSVAAKQHVMTMSTYINKRERRVFLGRKIGSAAGDVSTIGTIIYLARSMNHKRVLVVDQPSIQVNVQQTDGTFLLTELDGFFAAAAYAGLVASLPDVAEPSTNKEFSGIVDLGVLRTDPEKDNLAINGVTVIDKAGLRISVRDALTTDSSTLENFKLSVGMADDFMARSLRDAVKEFIGTKSLDEVLSAIEQRVKSLLGDLIKKRIIRDVDFNNLSVERGTGAQKTFVFIRFLYAPVYPLDVIQFEYGYDLK